MFVNFFLTSFSLNQRPLLLPGFHGIWCSDYWSWKSKVNQYVLLSFNSLLNDREFCVTPYFLRVAGTCVIKKGTICVCVASPSSKSRGTAPFAYYFINDLFNFEVIIYDCVLSNGNVIR